MGIYFMNWVETDLGFTMEKDQHLIFFGKSHAHLDKIKEAYPDLSFRAVKQTHSDVCILSANGPELGPADAHYTTEENIALVIKTADCLPILAYNKDKKIILAVHAGWRGVQNQITSKSMQKIQTSFDHVFIGPHILQKSFEVDPDVKQELQTTYEKYGQPISDKVFTARGTKYYIDLDVIVASELKSIKSSAPIHPLQLDTVTDLRFNSYRRDRQNAGRNLSFIARLKS